MKVFARCNQEVVIFDAAAKLLRIATWVGNVEVKPHSAAPDGLKMRQESSAPDWMEEIEIFQCDGCPVRFGPRDEERLPQILQQFRLVHGDYPWKGGGSGWYCMGCSFPPR